MFKPEVQHNECLEFYYSEVSFFFFFVPELHRRGVGHTDTPFHRLCLHPFRFMTGQQYVLLGPLSRADLDKHFICLIHGEKVRDELHDVCTDLKSETQPHLSLQRTRLS